MKNNGKRVLILSPHADDAELGCGGSILKFIEEGASVRWVVFSTAEESLPPGFAKDTLRKEFQNVLSDIGLSEKDAVVHSFQVRNLKSRRQDVLEELIQIKKEFDPDLVVGPSTKDFHQDHQVVSQEAVRAFKTSASIIGYELPWNHVSFDTNLFIRLDEHHIEKKFQLLNNYKSQFVKERGYLTKDFIYGLARVRGVQCEADFAEAFEVIKWMM